MLNMTVSGIHRGQDSGPQSLYLTLMHIADSWNHLPRVGKVYIYICIGQGCASMVVYYLGHATRPWKWLAVSRDDIFLSDS